MRRFDTGPAGEPFAANTRCVLGLCRPVALAAAGLLFVACTSVRSDRLLSSAALSQMLAGREEFLFVNTHVPYEGEIEQTDAFIPYNEIEDRQALLPSDRSARIVVYCRTGVMSAAAAATLTRLGYSNVWDLAGGMNAWQRAGLPLARR